MNDLAGIFEEFYNSNRKDLYSFLLRSLRDEHMALDLTQDAFLNFFQMFQKKTMPDSIQSRMYLFKIARNLMINLSKKSYVRKVDLLPVYGGEEHSITQPRKKSVEDQVLDRMENEADAEILNKILDRMDEEHRTALVLRYQQSLRLEDIARIMDISVSTASRLVKKSVQMLILAGKGSGLGER